MEGVTVVSSFMFSFRHVNVLALLSIGSLLFTELLGVYCKDHRYRTAALVTTIILLPLFLFATMNLNIPWQKVTIDETVIAEEFFESYKVIDVEDGIYYVRPLDN
jgi:hypothetical protein